MIHVKGFPTSKGQVWFVATLEAASLKLKQTSLMDYQVPSVDGWNPANHLGCMKPYK